MKYVKLLYYKQHSPLHVSATYCDNHHEDIV